MTIKNRKKNISAEPGDIVIDVTKNTLTKTNNNSNFSNNLILTIKQQDYINETNTPHTKTIEIPMSEVVRLAYLQNNYYNKTDADTKFGVTVEQTDAETGSAVTYVIKQNNTQVGTKINIPKDFLVKSASLKTSTANNKPIAGINKNDKYLDFVINAKDNSETNTHIYINVKDLVDIYTADESTLTLSNSNQFSIKDGGITESKLATILQTTINNKVDKIEGKGLSTYDYTKADKTLVGTIASKATTEYVDEQILGVLDPNGVVRLEIASKADAIHTHKLEDLIITSTFDGTEDLNDFVTQGRYKCGAANSKTVKNVPFYNIAFILDVINYNPVTPVQIIYTVTGNNVLAQTWYRVKSGDWTDWKQLSGVRRIYPKINPDGTGENNDLNNYINQGTYMCWTTTDATNVQNTPVDTPFSLIVLPTAYSSSYYGCTQIVKTYNVSGNNANQIWTRNYYKSGTNTETWTDWNCVSYDGHTHVKEDITNFSHKHNKTDINVVTIPKNADLNDDTYWNIGIYYIGSTNGGTISNRPENLTGNFAFELEVCGYGGTLLQILKVSTSNNNAERIYYRAKTGVGMSQWFKIAHYDEIPTIINNLTSGGTTSALSAEQGKILKQYVDGKAPTSHTDSNGAYGKATTSLYGHTMLSSAINSTSETLAATPKAVRLAYNLADGKPNLGTTATTAATGNHTHGNLSNTGTIGSTANLPIITTTSGKLTTGRFGSAENTFCQGNDPRLSDDRTPKSHTSTNTPTYGAGTSSQFGHVKVSDTYTTNSGAASNSVAASSKAVYDAYTNLNTKITSVQNDLATRPHKKSLGWHIFSTQDSSNGGYIKVNRGGKLQVSLYDGETSIITIDGSTGTINKIPGLQIFYDINGVNYSKTTDSNGITEININLAFTGEYQVNFIFHGNEIYAPTYRSIRLQVL